MTGYPPYYDNLMPIISQLREEGRSIRDIARRLKRSETTIRRIMMVGLIGEYEHYSPGQPEVKKKLTIEQRDRIAHDQFIEDLRQYHPEKETLASRMAELHKENKAVRKTADKLRLSERTVRKIMMIGAIGEYKCDRK